MIAGGTTTAPARSTLLGVRLLPAPAGEPQTIHLADGSVLVPLARVGRDGTTQPLTGGGAAAAPVAPVPAPAPVPASAPVAAPAPVSAAVPPAAGFEPKGFLYNDRYFRKFHAAGGIDVSDVRRVEERATRATFAYLLEEEPNVDDFGVTGVRMRRADPVGDSDLLRINPRAHWVVDVDGVQGDRVLRSIPSVVNSDGAVFVDPRIRGGS